MKLFLDTGDIEEIREFSRWGILDGVTTTPTFFRRMGVKSAREAIRAMTLAIDGEIHVEALGATAKDLIETAKFNRELGPRVVSKIPIGPEGLEATVRLHDEGIAVNLHLVFTVNQAVLAAKARAAYVCPLWGRMQDAGLDALSMVSEMSRALSTHGMDHTQVMVSSIRRREQATKAFLTGAGAFTIKGDVLRAMLANPLTKSATAILAQDALETSLVAERMRGLDSLPHLPGIAPLSDALRQMTAKGVGIAAVLEGNALAGVVTDGDVRRFLMRNEQDGTAPVKTVMTRNPKSVSSEAPVSIAVDLMRKHRIAQVIVVSEDRLPVGFISLHDLMVPNPSS